MSHTETADVSRYTYRVTWSVEDDEFVATCAEFPSLSWLADSQPAALQGLVDLIADTVADLVAESEAVPEPLSERSYSGKFNLRVGESLHRRLAIQPPRNTSAQPVRRATPLKPPETIRNMSPCAPEACGRSASAP